MERVARMLIKSPSTRLDVNDLNCVFFKEKFFLLYNGGVTNNSIAWYYFICHKRHTKPKNKKKPK